MRDLLSWNLSLGRWAGVQVRLHVFFVLFIAVALQLGSSSGEAAFWETVVGLLILLASVLAHEFGHCLAAARMGGAVDQILLWPLGGLAPVQTSHDPQIELLTAVAGPLVNLSVCTIAAPLLFIEGHSVLELFNPLLPPMAKHGLTWVDGVAWTFWINWLLFLVNFLPAAPLDMGRALRAMLCMQNDFRHGVVMAARVAQSTAFGLWFAAGWLAYNNAQSANPQFGFAVLPLVLLGVLLFFSARQEAERVYDPDADEAPFGYDFSQGYTSLEKAAQPRASSQGMFRKWLIERRQERLRRQQLLEAEEERRADAVLAKLHQDGLHALSEDERSLLNRVSARYRNRQRG
ncbi:MAG TPA: site-2 protease family protein [Pirellulales bacterium]|nr:site-2 protease family protein [Pirellulales bacterium]